METTDDWLTERLDRLWPKADGRLGFVYFVRCGEYVKIGMATNRVEGRIASFLTACPYDVKLLFYIKTTPIGARVIEARLHQHFAPQRHRNEWFLISNRQAQSARLDAIGLARRISILELASAKRHQQLHMEKLAAQERRRAKRYGYTPVAHDKNPKPQDEPTSH